MTVHFPGRRSWTDSARQHAVIEASAGTGKTYTIEHMVVDLIVRGRVPLDRDPRPDLHRASGRRATAADSIQDRRDPGRSPKTAQSASRSRWQGGWLIDERARQDLSRALFSFDGASIGTIHGFFGRVLTEHAFTSGRLFDGALEDGRELFGRAFKTALRRSLARRPSDAADLLALWLEQGRGGIEKLEALLWTCHSSRRRILPPFSIEATAPRDRRATRCSTSIWRARPISSRPRSRRRRSMPIPSMR